MSTDLMSQDEVFALIGKKRTAMYYLRKRHGFPAPVLTHPAKYSRQLVEKWLAEGGVNRVV